MRYAVPRSYSLPSRSPAHQLACGVCCHPASIEARLARPAPTPLVSRGDFVRVVWFTPQCEWKLSSTTVAIVFVCGSRNVDEVGGIEEAVRMVTQSMNMPRCCAENILLCHPRKKHGSSHDLCRALQQQLMGSQRHQPPTPPDHQEV